MTRVPADEGKTANYGLPWASTRGERGPWSEVTSLNTPFAGPTGAA